MAFLPLSGIEWPIIWVHDVKYPEKGRRLLSPQNRSTRTKSRKLIAGLFALALIATACGSSGDDVISLGDEPLAPDVEVEQVDPAALDIDSVDFAYRTFEGEGTTFSQLPEGQPVVLNFFASWCPSCIAELPDFETVSQNLAGDVVFLGLATSDRLEDAEGLLAETGVTFNVGTDESGEIFRLFEGISMPTTVFLNENHEIIRVHSGVLNVESLTDTINEDLL